MKSFERAARVEEEGEVDEPRAAMTSGYGAFRSVNTHVEVYEYGCRRRWQTIWSSENRESSSFVWDSVEKSEEVQ